MTEDSKSSEMPVSEDVALEPPVKDGATGTDANEPAEWKPTRGTWLIFLCLAIISLIVSLDSSIIGPAIPVSTPNPQTSRTLTKIVGTGHRTKPRRHSQRKLLGRHLLPRHLRHLPTLHRLALRRLRPPPTPLPLPRALHTRNDTMLHSAEHPPTARRSRHPRNWRWWCARSGLGHYDGHCAAPPAAEIL